MLGKFRGDRCGKAVAVHGKRAAGGNLMRVGCRHDQRVGQPHLGMDDADGIAGGVIGAERIGADQFGKPIGLVGGCLADAAHFMQDDRNAGIGDLPGGLRTGKTAADNVNGFVFGHGRLNTFFDRFVAFPALAVGLFGMKTLAFNCPAHARSRGFSRGPPPNFMFSTGKGNYIRAVKAMTSFMR